MKIKTRAFVRPDKKAYLDHFAEQRRLDYKNTPETRMNDLASWVTDAYNVVLTQDPTLNRSEIAYLRTSLVEPMLKETWANKKLK